MSEHKKVLALQYRVQILGVLPFHVIAILFLTTVTSNDDFRVMLLSENLFIVLL